MDRIEDDWVAVVPAAFLKIIEKISRLATVAEASKGCTDSGKRQIFEQWSSKHKVLHFGNVFSWGGSEFERESFG